MICWCNQQAITSDQNDYLFWPDHLTKLDSMTQSNGLFNYIPCNCLVSEYKQDLLYNISHAEPNKGAIYMVNIPEPVCLMYMHTKATTINTQAILIGHVRPVSIPLFSLQYISLKIWQYSGSFPRLIWCCYVFVKSPANLIIFRILREHIKLSPILVILYQM